MLRYKYVNEKFKNCDNDSKKLFSTLDEIIGKHKDTILPERKSNAMVANDMAEFFMNKIHKINDALKDHNMHNPEHKRVEQELTQFKPINCMERRKIILGSKPTTCWTDPIPSAFMKENLDMLLPVLLRIINHSITMGSFNKLWKLSTIVPLQKKKVGSDKSLANYRLVNNLLFLSKIVEKVILNQLQSHINEHLLLSSRLCAYRPGYSMELAILKITNDVLHGMDLQCVTPLVAIDLSAAFNTVNHSIMLLVLEHRFSITNNALKWFHEYLCDRSIVVEINGMILSELALPFLVLQGSCASLVLFNLYISTLYQTLQDQGSGAEVIRYADDTSAYKSYPADSSAKESVTVTGLELDIELTKQWMAENRLNLNDTKTEYIVFGNYNQLAKCHHHGIKIGEETIHKSNKIRLLGVHLDMQVTVKEHIKLKSAKVAYNVHIIYELCKVLSKDTTKSLVYAVVSSHMDCCNSVMAGLHMETLKPLQRIQNLAAKLVCRRNLWASAMEALKSLHWLNIEDRILFKVLCIVYRHVNKQGPEFLNEMLNVKAPT